MSTPGECVVVFGIGLESLLRHVIESGVDWINCTVITVIQYIQILSLAHRVENKLLCAMRLMGKLDLGNETRCCNELMWMVRYESHRLSSHQLALVLV